MHPDSASLAGLRAQAGELAGRMQRMTGALADLQQQIRAVEVTATSRDEYVRVTVGHDGVVRDLWLDSRIYRHADSAALARTVLDTIAVAVQAARERVREITEPYVDGETLDSYASGDLTEAMERFRQRLPFVEG